MKHLTPNDLAQIKQLAELYAPADPVKLGCGLLESDCIMLARAFLQVYSDKPRRDDDPVPSDDGWRG